MWPINTSLEARNAEELLGGIHRFGDAVAEEHERVAGLELEADGGVFRFGNEADRIRTFGEDVLGDAARIRNGDGWPALMYSRWP